MAEPYQFAVGADHPALAGHFPGNPIVPGVVILDHVRKSASQSLTASLGRRLTLRQVKFLHPLLPAQQAEVSWQPGRKAANAIFQVSHAGQLLAEGTVSFV